MKTVRCAIYTRKSSDEGLDQAFNSLDAQREACAAYILSQASEGWAALPEIYDDGGISGGTLERPALQRLLTEVAAGRIDIIVVYKVDRLSRSLFDFAKLVEQFEAAGTSFVSVTQSFNTTTSMGRLTLNMLLSFAQFEREVTAERIRDKIAASKAKGMWMGGTPPIGYKPDGRTLVIVPEHAAIVKEVFQRYIALGNVRLVAEQLARDGVCSPSRITATGKAHGGIPFSRGQIYKMLSNPLYIGVIEHKGDRYPGLHQAIIDPDSWEHAQARLAENLQGHRSGARTRSPSLLAGRVVDDAGQPLVATHATKPVASGAEGSKLRYRYYVSRAAQHSGEPGMRIPARELEALVVERLRQELGDPLALADKAGLLVEPHDIMRLHGETIMLDRAATTALVEQVRVGSGTVDIVCSDSAIAARLGIADGGGQAVTFTCNVRLTRSGRVMRLIDGRGASAAAARDPSLGKLIAKARRWWFELCKGEHNITALAAREGVTPSYMTRVVRLAFLAPTVVEAALAGRLRAGVDGVMLVATGAVAGSWDEQRAAMLPARVPHNQGS